ncbi:hypothetical protein KJA15_04075 [Patescibacteria group bacterium]|nr:hypothetical protein [Patescibacteria group bacterium]
MKKERKIFFVVVSGGHDTDRHYHDTIKNKRTIEEAAKFLSPEETEELRDYFHEQPYIVWGAVPGEDNIRNWEIMDTGDYVMIYREGRIILTAEVAMKVRSPGLAKYFWRTDKKGQTWEYIYFLINEKEVNLKQSEINKYIGYKEIYFPRGFGPVEQKKVNKLLSLYGDLISFLQVIEKGKRPEKIEVKKKEKFEEILEEKVEKAPTAHDEMQWRLIRLGKKSHFDVWVPKKDQNIEYEGEKFRDLVIPDFHETIDVPSFIKNIDTVWKLGFSIKSAFEIEHSTQIYSGLLRLSDLRALAPNSNYPLFIIAKRDKKNRVFRQLKRPTFSNDYLKLNEVVKFLSYDMVRELDESLKNGQAGFNIDWLIKKAESLV